MLTEGFKKPPISPEKPAKQKDELGTSMGRRGFLLGATVAAFPATAKSEESPQELEASTKIWSIREKKGLLRISRETILAFKKISEELTWINSLLIHDFHTLPPEDKIRLLLQEKYPDYEDMLEVLTSLEPLITEFDDAQKEMLAHMEKGDWEAASNIHTVLTHIHSQLNELDHELSRIDGLRDYVQEKKEESDVEVTKIRNEDT